MVFLLGVATRCSPFPAAFFSLVDMRSFMTPSLPRLLAAAVVDRILFFRRRQPRGADGLPAAVGHIRNIAGLATAVPLDLPIADIEAKE